MSRFVKTSRASPAWLWPFLLGTGTILALVAALATEDRPGWGLCCALPLVAPLVVLARACLRR